MAAQILEDARAVRQALATNRRKVSISISRETAEFLADIVDAKANGKEVLITRSMGEVSPMEAAVILGVSRPQVRKIMDSGRLPFRMVGAHHRISINDLCAFQETERIRRKEGMHKLMSLENELGL